MSGYKSEKEAFVSGTSGSSVSHINLISCAALASVFLYNVIHTRSSSSDNLLLSWAVLVLPLLLSMTVFADIPILLVAVLSATTFGLSRLPPKEIGTPLPSDSRNDIGNSTDGSQQPVVSQLSALTTYRAHMILMTILAILAVDFPIFPRNLAKCETFGVSLMDIGVGSFVFSQGVVSAIPVLKDPSYLSRRLSRKFLSTLKKVSPLLALGLLRVLAIKGTEYPEHESEYGTHWNFFITMALVPLLEVFMHPLVLRVPISMLGVFVALGHQLSLGVFGLQAFALTAPRISLISANKEGIISLPGYLAIHLLGLSTGTIVLPPSPSYFRRVQKHFSAEGVVRAPDVSNKRRKSDKAAMELFSYTAVWWWSMGLVRLFRIDGDEGVSRRVVNLSYVLWIAAFNTSFLLGYWLLDMFFYPQPPRFKKKRNDDDESNVLLYREPASPLLLEAINKNALVTFLLANILTGAVNLNMATMYMGNTSAMIVLSAYSFAICAVAWVFRRRRLWKM